MVFDSVLLWPLNLDFSTKFSVLSFTFWPCDGFRFILGFDIIPDIILGDNSESMRWYCEEQAQFWHQNLLHEGDDDKESYTETITIVSDDVISTLDNEIVYVTNDSMGEKGEGKVTFMQVN